MANAVIQRATPLRASLSRDDLIQGGGLIVMALFIVVAMALPLFWILSKSFEDADGTFVGLVNYIRYFSTPALVTSAEHSIRRKTQVECSSSVRRQRKPLFQVATSSRIAASQGSRRSPLSVDHTSPDGVFDYLRARKHGCKHSV